jgi:hypothetical protein
MTADLSWCPVRKKNPQCENSIKFLAVTHVPQKYYSRMKTSLKGQSHEIFELRFFSSNISP